VKKVILDCPTCHKTKFQGLPDSLMEERHQIDKGIVAILIPENTICTHSFIVYIDMNFAIRDVVSIEQVQEEKKKLLVSLKTIEDLVSNLNKKSLQSVLSKL
jgi:hypothetical protein